LQSRANGYLIGALFFLLAAVGVYKLLKLLSQSDPWNPLRDEALPAERHGRVFNDFFKALEIGPEASVATVNAPTPPSAGGEPGATPLQILEPARALLATLKATFTQVGPADDRSRLRLLHQIRTDLLEFSPDAESPMLQPFLQVVTGLEGLLTQVLKKSANITPSVLRTIGGALEVFEALCTAPADAVLATASPVRVLAVDDDAVSRRAISFALQKAFPPPETAETGEAALELAARRSYDLIFLDVEMPGLDGFEVCSRIHQLAPNRATPVVLATSHDDFDSRAESVLTGAKDLISKPYFSFEIVVKALTLIFRSRLHLTPTRTAAEAAAQEKAPNAKARAAEDAGPKLENKGGAPAGGTAPVESSPDSARPPAEPSAEAAAIQPSSDEFAAAFFASAQAQIPALRAQLKEFGTASEPAVRHELLSHLYIGARALASDAEQAELRSLVRFCTAFLALFRKLLEAPDSFAPHLLETADAALNTLEALCRSRLNPDLFSPPISIMVVDDDAICRRALSGALQLAFERPHVAESVEAALALTQQMDFDAIFMDVQMPGMDGFTACTKIRQTARNGNAPIVFVTIQSDLKSREQAAAAGGSGFISKPVVSVEITLTALTLALQRRLACLREAQPCK
jgi:CheY-like chemotaxis protein